MIRSIPLLAACFAAALPLYSETNVTLIDVGQNIRVASWSAG